MNLGEALRVLAEAGIPVTVNINTGTVINGDVHVDKSITRNFVLGDQHNNQASWIGRMEDRTETVPQLESGFKPSLNQRERDNQDRLMLDTWKL